MKVRIVVGSVAVSLTGMDLTKRDVLKMLGEIAGIALAVSGEEEEDDKPSTPIGFSATIERAPDLPAEDWFSDDEE